MTHGTSTCPCMCLTLAQARADFFVAQWPPRPLVGHLSSVSDYAGPCARELRLSGMNEEQLLAIAKYCRLESPCQ